MEPVSDVEECLEDLDDVLGHLFGDGRSCVVNNHLVSLAPPHSQALLQGFGQHRNPALLMAFKAFSSGSLQLESKTL